MLVNLVTSQSPHIYKKKMLSCHIQNTFCHKDLSLNQTTRTSDYLFSQPHQPFFIWGVLNAIIMMTLFLLSYKGILTFEIRPGLFHAYTLIFIIFTAFFQGFLLTTFPRFSQMPPLDKSIYTTNFTLLFAGTLLFLTGLLWTKWLMAAGMLLLLGNQLFTFYAFWQIYKASPSPDKHDQFWIMSAFGSGIVAHTILIIATVTDALFLQEAAIQSALYLYLVFVAFSVGQRMIPFFSHVMIVKNKNLLKISFVLFILGITANLIIAPLGALFFLTAGIWIAREIYRWKLPYKDAEPILWILHLAIFWLPTGLILGALADIAGWLLERNFLFLSLHLVALGFVTTVLIGFGTRVTLGHSGNMMVTDNRTKMLFYMTQAVVYMRLLYSVTATPFLFDITILLWLLLFGGWALKYMPALAFGKRIT